VIAALTFPRSKCNPMAILILHDRSNRMRFRDPRKVSQIQLANGNRAAVDDDPVLSYFDDFSRESDEPFEKR